MCRRRFFEPIIASVCGICLLAATVTPWFSTGYVIKQEATDIECVQNTMIGWTRQYCHSKLDTGCPMSIECSEGSDFDWREGCSSCDERKALYNTAMSLMILSVLFSVGPVCVSVLRGCGKRTDFSRVMQACSIACFLLLAISVIVFAAKHPGALKEDDQGSCGKGLQGADECTDFFGKKTLEAFIPEGQTQLYTADYVWGGYPGWLVALLTTPISMAMMYYHTYPPSLRPSPEDYGLQVGAAVHMGPAGVAETNAGTSTTGPETGATSGSTAPVYTGI